MSRFYRPTILTFVVLLTLLAGTGYVDKALNWCGLSRLTEVNQSYLQSSFDRSLKLFGVLSAVKVGLAVVEGSEVGVGFGIEVGDVVQASYDHVDVAWRTVLAAAVLLKGTRFLLETAGFLGPWLLTPALIFIVLMLSLRWFAPGMRQARRLARDGSLFFFVAAIALYLTLPLSVVGGRLLSDKITAPSLQEAETGIIKIEKQLSRLDPRVEDGLFSGLTNATGKIGEFAMFLKVKTVELVTLLFTIMAVYIFDCVVFPLLLFFILFWSTQLFGRYLLGIHKSNDFCEDLSGVLAPTSINPS